MYITVGTDGKIYVKPTRGWADVTSPHAQGLTFLDATMLHDGSILAIDAAHNLQILATPAGPADKIACNIQPEAVTTLLDGTVIALAQRKLYWTRPPRRNDWRLLGVQPPDGITVIDLTTLPNGCVRCLGADNHYCDSTGAAVTRWSPPTTTDSPTPIITRIEALRDGTVLGVTAGKKLAVLLQNDWAPVETGVSLTNVTALAGTTLLGIRGDQRLVTRDGTLLWQEVPGPNVRVISVAAGVQPGTILACGDDGSIHEAPLVEGAPPQVWRPWPARAPTQLIALATSPTGTVVGLKNDGRPVRLQNGGWSDLSWPGPPFRTLAMLPDGQSLLCVEKDGPNVVKRWQFKPGPTWADAGSGPPTASISVNPDGSVVELAPDGYLYYRPSTAQDAPRTLLEHGPRNCCQLAQVQDAADTRWLLPFTSDNPVAVTGGGRPWGDGTAMAARAAADSPPYDRGNRVTPLIGGDEALGAIRDAFEAAIIDAGIQEAKGAKPGERGHVYIVGWLLNGLRDLSDSNPWYSDAWTPNTPAVRDQTALGLIARLMQAGIKVRVMMWMPTSVQGVVAGAHADQHWSLAAAIQELNNQLAKRGPDWAKADPIGVCALDLRTPKGTMVSLHQKMVAIRVGAVNVGFCGGVDLAFTRRDYQRPVNMLVGKGDWQSGTGIPVPADGWPRQAGVVIPEFPIAGSKVQYPDELGQAVYGQPRHWHDQHLKLEGPIVATLEDQFDERWRISSAVYTFDPNSRIGGDNQVQFTSPKVYTPAPEGGHTIQRLQVQPCEPVGNAIVQLWRTIPLDDRRKSGPFMRGEFTVMAGVANAVAQAQQLITIWDQYFWSLALVRLLARRLNLTQTLRAIIIIPAHGSGPVENEMWYRRRAMQEFWKILSNDAKHRVLVLNAWSQQGNYGVYVHAKVQTYDGSLLVCGSANLNRRSFLCDMELDCAVVHPATVQWHLGRLAHMVTGAPWTNFGQGWTERFWDTIKNGSAATMIPDPFFKDEAAIPKTTPNRIPYLPDILPALIPETNFEPSSIWNRQNGLEGIEPSDNSSFDKNAKGRLDHLVYLIERYTAGQDFPYRKE